MNVYSIKFDEMSCHWSTDQNYNLYYLISLERHFNDCLSSRGYVFLSEVYGKLDIPLSKRMLLAGWVYTGIRNIIPQINFKLFPQQDGSIIVDFGNVEDDISYHFED
jgi:hypothetical protein